LYRGVTSSFFGIGILPVLDLTLEETRKIVFRGERGPQPTFLVHDFFQPT
jgi:hypothetical protein